jgi:phage/plasmid primase-like uncharacterized protein
MSDFISFARAHGVEIDPSRLYAGERIRRCGTTDKPRSTNGAYFWDGKRGFVWNWAAEARAQWFSDADAHPWTEAEKAEWRAKRFAAQSAKDREYQRAAMRGAEMMRDAQPGEHGYLTIKGFPEAQGFVAKDGALLIPMRNLATNNLQGLQVIRWDEPARKYEKKMLPGMRAKGAVFRMGDKTAPETFLVEGYATGLSVLAALRSIGLRASVLVCFSANNIEVVAQQLSCKAFVCADNDASKTGQTTAEKTGLPYCMSPIEGEDFNDLHARAGLFAVCQLLMGVRRK